MGGLGFSLSMVWAQTIPFVALQFYDGHDKENITIFLVCSFLLWLLLNAAFFNTIDMSFIGTFFSTLTGPQYAVELFEQGEEDFQKFDAIFIVRLDFTKKVHEEAKAWVADIIDQWKNSEKAWFNIGE